MIFPLPESVDPALETDDGSSAKHNKRREGFAGSIPGGFFLEFFIIAGVSAFISWICLLIDDRWPGTFPITIDYAYFFAFGLVVLLHAYLAHMSHQYNEMLRATARLGANATAFDQLNEAARLVLGEHPQGDNLSALTAAGSLESRKATGYLLSSVSQLDSPVLHRIVQFCVYLFALILPWGLWFTFKWFTVLVTPMIMVPFLLARQYASKMRYKARLSNRYSKAWLAPQTVLNSASTALNRTQK